MLVIRRIGFEELCGFVSTRSIVARVRANSFDRFGAYVVWFFISVLELYVFFVWFRRHLFERYLEMVVANCEC